MEMTNKGPVPAHGSGDAARRRWCRGLPFFIESGILLREPEAEDATSLFVQLGRTEVSRFLPVAPTSVEQFQHLVRRYQRLREEGTGFSFAVFAPGEVGAVGLFRVRGLEAGFGTAEWTAALAPRYWGSGLFERCASHVLDFTFHTIAVSRLEARTVVVDGRGNGALGKVGAVQEGILRRSFMRDGQYHDQVLWSLLADDWQRRRSVFRPRIH